MAKQSAEIIAFYLCQDLAEMREYRYQPTKWSTPAVYSFGDERYYAAPTSGKMPKGYCGLNDWQHLATEFGRKIFMAKS